MPPRCNCSIRYLLTTQYLSSRLLRTNYYQIHFRAPKSLRECCEDTNEVKSLKFSVLINEELLPHCCPRAHAFWILSDGDLFQSTVWPLLKSHIMSSNARLAPFSSEYIRGTALLACLQREK